MADAAYHLMMALAGLVALAILVHAALRCWTSWLDLKRAEIERRPESQPASALSRIEVADIRERLRKLEAIAAGVDL